MRYPLALVAVALVLINTPRMVVADPITYDFTGALNQPIDGSTTFSGSLTINATPPIRDGQPEVTENGSDVSLTLNVGGQVFNLLNSPQSPATSATFSAFKGLSSSFGPYVEFAASGGFGGAAQGGSNVSFTMTLYDYGPTSLPTNLASLKLFKGTSDFGLWLSTGGPTPVTGGGSGALTSFEMVSTPEPNSLAIFAGLGIAALVRHRYRDSRH